MAVGVVGRGIRWRATVAVRAGCLLEFDGDRMSDIGNC